MTVKEFTKEEYDEVMRVRFGSNLSTYDSNPAKPLTKEDLREWVRLYTIERERRRKERFKMCEAFVPIHPINIIHSEIRFTSIS